MIMFGYVIAAGLAYIGYRTFFSSPAATPAASPQGAPAQGVPQVPLFGFSPGDIVVFDADNTPDPQGLPLPPIKGIAAQVGGVSDEAISSFLSPRDVTGLNAALSARGFGVPGTAVSARTTDVLSKSGLILAMVTGVASPLPNSIVLALADPRINQTGAIPSLPQGIVMRLSDPLTRTTP
jgi:hypothetical protein